LYGLPAAVHLSSYREEEMNNAITNILLVGVGGQGILLASEILSEAFMLAGFDVKKSEIHGMSQRGGSVVSHVRFGTEVFSPVVPEGEGDILFGFELLETYRYLSLLKPGASVIANDYKIAPPAVLLGQAVYPKSLPEKIQQKYPDFLLVDGQGLAMQAGDLRAANTVMLGAVSRRLQITEDVWLQALEKMVPEKALAMNLKAFAMGRAL
jgi:indolepyruvate ferredoxin oxidoreductase beta subunit